MTPQAKIGLFHVNKPVLTTMLEGNGRHVKTGCTYQVEFVEKVGTICFDKYHEYAILLP
jgi:hypothetical protein